MDNLDIGCALIKNSVIAKALQDVKNDKVIKEQIEARSKAKNLGKQYYNKELYQVIKRLPPQLQPKLGGLTKEEFSVYESFGIKKQVKQIDLH